jgi:hypothetical protein
VRYRLCRRTCAANALLLWSRQALFGQRAIRYLPRDGNTPRSGVSNIANGVVAAQHGWGQACPELGLPGYDALGPMSSNINLVIGSSAMDAVSGVLRFAHIVATSRSWMQDQLMGILVDAER